MEKLGKLKQIGIESHEQVALYMPTSFLDYRYPITCFNPSLLVPGQEHLFQGVLVGTPATKFKNGNPMTTFSISDGIGDIRFTLFGDVRELVAELTNPDNVNKPIYVYGQYVYETGAYINGAKIISSDLVGRVIPVYPGVPGKMKPDTVHSHIRKHIEVATPLAAAKLRSFLVDKFPDQKSIRQYLNASGLTLEQVLNNIHNPTDIHSAYHSLEISSRIAAIVAADELIKKAREAEQVKPAPKIVGPGVQFLARNIPFKPTAEQTDIVSRTIDKLAKGQLIDMLLQGDVGSGKTATYGMIAAYTAYAGGRVAIMLPNGNLAQQIYRELAEYFPDLNPLLIMGESEYTDDELKASKMLIGTTALLFRNIGELQMAVFDESQKMGVSQQQELTGEATHKISVSATPIPRTMALGQYGAVQVEKITKCHAQKVIHTRVLHSNNYPELVNAVMWSVLTAKKQALIVCARKEDADDSDATSGITSTEQVFEEFNQYLPGLVAISHGGLSTEENAKAIQSMRDGTKRLLIATTVVEVGVTLPDLNYAAVYDADRFGLSQLHQLSRQIGKSWWRGFL